MMPRPPSRRLLQAIGRTAVVLCLLALALTASGCTRPQAQPHYTYTIPERLDDGWEVSSLAAEGIDTPTIVRLTEQIEQDEYNAVHGCLIVKNGLLVYEEYFHGFRREKLHRLYSVTKSVTSALIGIAIDRGQIGGVDETVVSFFPEYVDEGWDHAKDAITLEHLLTMTAGLKYDEHSYAYSDPRNSHTQMTEARDWMRWTLEQPLVARPGTRFAYSTGNSQLFSGIIHKATGLYANQFAEECLFAPLGIQDYFWTIGGNFPATGGSNGGLKLCARDMAKFGYVYLTGGRWKGVQVVPEEWVEESLVSRIQAWGGAQYGYQWWIHRSRVAGTEIDWFAAHGHGDQLIALFPSLDLVVVLTCGNEQSPAPVDNAVLAIAEAAS